MCLLNLLHVELARVELARVELTHVEFFHTELPSCLTFMSGCLQGRVLE